MRTFLVFFAILVIFGSFQCIAQEPDDDLITIESALVVLNATITDQKGEPVSNLKEQDFTIFEDGIEQNVEVFESFDTPFAAVILLDTSGSMESRVSLARSAAINFLSGLRSDDVAAIYNFDSKVSLVQDFSNSRDVAYKFFDLKADGWTVMNDAIVEAAQTLAKRPEKRKAIVVLSDGADTRSAKSSDAALKAATAAGATIYSVDMSNVSDRSREKMINQAALKNFSEKTGGIFVATPGGVAMREAFGNIVKELGFQYTLAYEPKNRKADGKWRKIELKVKKPDVVIRTRKGYHAKKAI